MKGKHISYTGHGSPAVTTITHEILKVALVTEGGGQRGIFTAGVLDAFIENKFNPFSLLIGTSAGSLNIASYICEQHRHAYRVISELTTMPKFFNMYRFLLGQQGLDLDWLLQQAPEHLQLDWIKGNKNMQHRTFLAVSSEITQYQAVYFDLMTDDKIFSLKTSCNIPIINKPIIHGTKSFVDGSVCGPIPVKEAYIRGYRHIVVIRTMPIDFKYDREWLDKIKMLFGKTRFANMLQLLTEHEKNYTNTQAFLKNPPDDVTIYEIHPDKILSSKLLGSNQKELDSDYQLGYQSGQYFLNSMEGHFTDSFSL